MADPSGREEAAVIDLIVFIALLACLGVMARPLREQGAWLLQARQLRQAERARIERAWTQPASPRPGRSCPLCAGDDWRAVGGSWICAECRYFAPGGPLRQPGDPSPHTPPPPNRRPLGEDPPAG